MYGASKIQPYATAVTVHSEFGKAASLIQQLTTGTLARFQGLEALIQQAGSKLCAIGEQVDAVHAEAREAKEEAKAAKETASEVKEAMKTLGQEVKAQLRADRKQFEQERRRSQKEAVFRTLEAEDHELFMRFVNLSVVKSKTIRGTQCWYPVEHNGSYLWGCMIDFVLELSNVFCRDKPTKGQLEDLCRSIRALNFKNYGKISKTIYTKTGCVDPSSTLATCGKKCPIFTSRAFFDILQYFHHSEAKAPLPNTLDDTEMQLRALSKARAKNDKTTKTFKVRTYLKKNKTAWGLTWPADFFDVFYLRGACKELFGFLPEPTTQEVKERYGKVAQWYSEREYDMYQFHYDPLLGILAPDFDSALVPSIAKVNKAQGAKVDPEDFQVYTEEDIQYDYEGDRWDLEEEWSEDESGKSEAEEEGDEEEEEEEEKPQQALAKKKPQQAPAKKKPQPSPEKKKPQPSPAKMKPHQAPAKKTPQPAPEKKMKPQQAPPKKTPQPSPEKKPHQAPAKKTPQPAPEKKMKPQQAPPKKTPQPGPEMKTPQQALEKKKNNAQQASAKTKATKKRLQQDSSKKPRVVKRRRKTMKALLAQGSESSDSDSSDDEAPLVKLR